MNISLVIAIIGAAVGMIIGVSVFSSVSETIECPDEKLYEDAAKKCEQVKSTAWTVVGILPIALFFVIYAMFGGLSSNEFSDLTPRKRSSQPRKITVKTDVMKKILLFIGLAKVKK